MVSAVRLSVSAATISLSCLFVGCEAPPTVEIPLATVSVAKPMVRDVNRYVVVTGWAEASQVFEARARVQGYLREFQPKEGRDVKKGDVLFQIEKEPFEAQLASAEASLASSVAQKKLADANLARISSLFDKNVSTKAELDVAQADVDVATAAILRDEATVKQAKIELSYTEIQSETDGMIGEVDVDPGNLVGTSQSSLLATVRRYHPLHIYFFAPEGILLQYLRENAPQTGDEEPGAKIAVQFEGEQGFPHIGKINLFDNTIDQDTGKVMLRGAVDNKEKRVLPGAFARIRLEASGDTVKDAVLIDERAIGTDLTGKYLLIVDSSDTVQRRRIRLGQLYGGFRHIEAMWDETQASAPAGDAPAPIDTDFRYVLLGVQKARVGSQVKISEEIELTFPEVPLEAVTETEDAADATAADGPEEPKPEAESTPDAPAS